MYTVQFKLQNLTVFNKRQDVFIKNVEVIYKDFFVNLIV